MITGRARAMVVIAVLVVASAIAGAGIDRMLVTRGPRHGRGGPSSEESSSAAAARRRAEMLGRMSRDLNLTPAQRVAVDSIMQRTDSALRVVRREMQPRLEQIYQSSRAEIAARLDSAQRVKFANRRPFRRGGRPPQ